MAPSTLNIARTLSHSAANGPGERFVIWVQGCTLQCPGCWNPDTWSLRPRNEIAVADLAAEILATVNIEGITLTGGEPFQQAGPLADLAEAVRAVGLSVFAFTGYELDELALPDQQRLLRQCDVVVCGRYVAEHRDVVTPWRGSTNQSIHFISDRYDASAAADSTCEVHIGLDGQVVFTGFPPSDLLSLAGES